jgi:glutamate racemase
MKIGVFDSGVGGLSVAKAIEKALPDDEVLLREDKHHVPYGIRTPEEILGYVVPILKTLVDDGCQVIVVACNTVTTTLITELRELFDVPLVAIEPMVKPAAELTKTKIIAVCATPTTLSSPRYKWLKGEYAGGITVLEPDCSDWAEMIENRETNREKIEARINEVLAAGADVIVLACTHYHWIEDEIRSLVNDKAQVIQPEEPTIAQLKRVIAQLP